METGPGGGGDDRSASAHRRRLGAVWFGRIDHQRAVVELHFEDAIVRQQVARRLVTGSVWRLLEDDDDYVHVSKNHSQNKS